MLAYLSGRVLGQYEVFSADPGQLLLVAPNIVEVERKLDADPRDFRLWVCLHEVTHRTQFTAVPWLRAHFLAEVAAFVDAGGAADQMAERVRQARRRAGRRGPQPGQPRARCSTWCRPRPSGAVLDRHHRADDPAGGARRVRHGRRRARRWCRASPRSGPGSTGAARAATRSRRLIRRLLGVDAKLRQYAEGRTFVHEVVSRVGMAGFNKVWESPLTLPLLAELADPQAWIARVGAARLPAAD